MFRYPTPATSKKFNDMTESLIATKIETELFNRIIEFLQKNDWQLVAEYDDQVFDKGIDFDFYQFIKDKREVLLSWNNWTEGELKTTKETIDEIALHTGIHFQFGNPEYLHQEDVMDKMHPLLKYY